MRVLPEGGTSQRRRPLRLIAIDHLHGQTVCILLRLTKRERDKPATLALSGQGRDSRVQDIVPRNLGAPKTAQRALNQSVDRRVNLGENFSRSSNPGRRLFGSLKCSSPAKAQKQTSGWTSLILDRASAFSLRSRSTSPIFGKMAQVCLVSFFPVSL